MKTFRKKIKSIERSSILFAAVILFSSACIALLLQCYFQAYKQPYMLKQVIDLSEGWKYHTENIPEHSLATLRTGPKLQSGETLTLSRSLDTKLTGAALLLRANHQAVKVSLDGELLYKDPTLAPVENPGMALHFIPLPQNYLHKTLTVEISSPYKLYAGRTSPILMGTIPSLEAYALSDSMRSLIMMAMCLLIGFGIIALTLLQSFKNTLQPQNLAIGIFSIIWALYYICTEYIAFQFFTPFWTSTLSLMLYFSFQIPLTLYFYFSFERYKKYLLPAVLLHGSFGILSILLQLFHLIDLPRLISANNVILGGLLYTLVLTILEAKNGNQPMRLAAPFFLLAYLSMLYNFYVFYTRQGVVPYTYKDTYFLLLLCILVYNAWHFFSVYYQGLREREVLLLQNRLSTESYEQIKAHLHQIGGLKHEMKNHVAALQTYLASERYDEAKHYLERYAAQSEEVTGIVYHEHFLLNAMIGRLLHTAKEQHIKVELDLTPCPIRIADPDFYSLLSNLLDNALEACKKVPEGIPTLICLVISRREPYLHITCQNTYTGELFLSNGNIQSSKRETGHGYGLWTVKKITDSYDGLIDIEFDQTTFTVTIALKD